MSKRKDLIVILLTVTLKNSTKEYYVVESQDAQPALDKFNASLHFGHIQNIEGKFIDRERFEPESVQEIQNHALELVFKHIKAA